MSIYLLFIIIIIIIEYAIKKVQETRLGMDMNGAHQILGYADDVNLIGDDIRTKEFSNKHKEK